MKFFGRVSRSAIAALVMTGVLWLLARRYMPPQFDAAETALLFLVSMVLVSGVQWLWQRFRQSQPAVAKDE